MRVMATQCDRLTEPAWSLCAQLRTRHDSPERALFLLPWRWVGWRWVGSELVRLRVRVRVRVRVRRSLPLTLTLTLTLP